MTSDETTPAEVFRDADHDEAEFAALGELLRGALEQPPAPRNKILPGVQERIRQQTHGRYFGRRSRWMRDPTMLLLIVATIILLIGMAVYLVLGNLLDGAAQQGEPDVSPHSGAEAPSSRGAEPRP